MAITTAGISVGAMAPDFTLVGSRGQIRLSEYRGKQHVIVYFMREFTCALSRKNVTQLQHLYSTLQARHAEILVIASGSRAEAEQLATTLHVPFPVLADADREVYRRYGLAKVLSLWQRSGTIVVDTQGRVSYLHPTTIPAGLDEASLMKALA